MTSGVFGVRAPDGLRELTLLPSQLPLTRAMRVDSVFGAGFASAIEQLPAGIWAGPVQSGYGLHLVRVVDRTQAELPNLQTLRTKCWPNGEKSPSRRPEMSLSNDSRANTRSLS